MPNIRKLAAALILGLAIVFAPRGSAAQVGVAIAVTIPPPPLPIYYQPPCPGPRFIWTPGYWAWGPYGYYWVPGTWVLAPRVGLLWTPGYWDWNDGYYLWRPGYWGRRVGYYGGIDYGFGYTRFGYVGGFWRGGRFFYNRNVNNVNVAVIHDTYVRRVGPRVTMDPVSYNGGPGGVAVRPNRAQEVYARERHFRPTPAQFRQERYARGIKGMRASFNRGRPVIAATARPGVFRGRGVVAALRAGGRYQPHPRLMERHRNLSRPATNSTRRGSPRVFRGSRVRPGARAGAPYRPSPMRVERMRNTRRPPANLSRNAGPRVLRGQHGARPAMRPRGHYHPFGGQMARQRNFSRPPAHFNRPATPQFRRPPVNPRQQRRASERGGRRPGFRAQDQSHGPGGRP